jgi:ribose transport system ATP-binding protein
MSTAVLRAHGLVKQYTGTVALDSVAFEICPGEVHALVGENGAGKSTLVKILTGVTRPNDGQVTIGDEPVVLASPRSARARGIAVVHQDSQLFDHLRVWENLAVSTSTGGSVVRRNRARSVARAILDRLAAPIDLDAIAGQLSPTERKLVEIARALTGESRFLLLDEPTAALDPTEAVKLAATIRRLADGGTGVVLVSHHLEEVIALADRVTVLRDGRNAGTFARGTYTERDLIAAMVGTQPRSLAARTRRVGERVVVSVRNERLVAGGPTCDLDLHEGEIVAAVGLVGSGASALLATVGGARRGTGGVVVVERDRRISVAAQAVRNGVGYLPPDRKAAGLPDLSVTSNVMIGSLRRRTRHGFCSHRAMRAATKAICERLGVRHRSVDQPMGTLSGGNQQKALIGRWLAADAAVLVIDEPTQGVDVGARAEIHAHLRAFADAGGSVLLASSDLDEVLVLADRVLVFRKGEVTHELHTPDVEAIDRTRLLACATGLGVPLGQDTLRADPRP